MSHAPVCTVVFAYVYHQESDGDASLRLAKERGIKDILPAGWDQFYEGLSGLELCLVSIGVTFSAPEKSLKGTHQFELA